MPLSLNGNGRGRQKAARRPLRLLSAEPRAPSTCPQFPLFCGSVTRCIRPCICTQWVPSLSTTKCVSGDQAQACNYKVTLDSFCPRSATRPARVQHASSSSLRPTSISFSSKSSSFALCNHVAPHRHRQRPCFPACCQGGAEGRSQVQVPQGESRAALYVLS